MIKVGVGVEDILYRLVGESLTIFAKIACSVTGINTYSHRVTFHKIAVVAIVENFPCTRCHFLRLEISLVHGNLRAIGILNQHLVAGREVDGVDSVPPLSLLRSIDDIRNVRIFVKSLALDHHLFQIRGHEDSAICRTHGIECIAISTAVEQHLMTCLELIDELRRLLGCGLRVGNS